MHFSSSKDKNPVMTSISYYGVIEEIQEVDYIKFSVPIFKCNKASYIQDPFIMAFKAIQVFYVNDPSKKSLSLVLQGKRHTW